MGHVRHIGRIGTLAVALGVGAAVTSTPAICSAAPPDSGAHSPSSAGESATDDAPTSSPLRSLRREADALSVKVRGSLRRVTSTAAGTARRPDTNSVVAAVERQEPPPVGERNAAADHGDRRAPLSDLARRLSVTDVMNRFSSITADTEAKKPAARRPGRAMIDEISGEAAALSTPVTPPTAPAPQLSPSSTAAILEPPPTPTPLIPRAAASRLITVALQPLLAPGPREPAPPSPVLWALVAWTRRHIGESNITVSNPTPPAAIQTTSAQPFALPDVTDPGSVLGGVIAHQLSIYDFTTRRGRTAFVLDYSWGLTGTALGAALQFVNTFVIPDSAYNDALSQDVGFFVYDGGIVFFPGFITTLGNVTTNGSGNIGVIEDHEAVHVWQSRVFGPFFQVSYVAWLAGGAVVGTAVWLTDTDEDWWSLVETAAYYDNPWEVWAYSNDNNWPPAGANPKLVWKF